MRLWGSCCDGDEVMLCVNMDKLAKGVAREPWDGTRNAKSCKWMMVAGAAGASGVHLPRPKCQQLLFYGRKYGEEGIPSLYCVGSLSAMMKITVSPAG